MLGKLLKHELFATGKILLPLNILLILATLFGKVLISLSVFPKGELSPISSVILVLLLTVYILILIALSVITTIYIVVRYYKTMFSREGYLTFTLPVSTNSILNAKTIVSSFWYFITTCNTVISVLLLLSGVIKKADQANTLNYDVLEEKFFHTFGLHPSTIWIMLLILAIISSIYAVLYIFMCINIGQLFTKHRIIAAVLTYVVINVILQIISFVITFSGQMTLLNSSSAESPKAIFHYLETLVVSMGIMYVVLCIIFYVVSSYILSKKVNIE